ncbi:hypothetical protein NEMBOFW57_005487 [Staphylotrichum longicolle]|uniref:Retrovirus-related Pol polyprotein from transposon TNT 1-94-like beta-barrel domain-containing protein n=1 Tax=Staphylotrichum longicolle TaxID=669026 RepID=A0AAD4EX42_9PEZI|nr:hypothetical protein NEMBOFW57_005487 [Staphylotrichum longicolle]
MASSSTATLPCPDWVLSSNSDVHVARDRSWFTTYTPFQTYITSHSGDSVDAIGVGDVVLPVKLFPHLHGKRAHGTLRLRNVLHVPSALCNIVGGPVTDDYAGMQLGGLGDSGRDAVIMDIDGRRLAYFTRARFWVVKLSGPPVGPVVGRSSWVGDCAYMVHAFWTQTERQKWAAAGSDSAPPSSQTNRAETYQGPVVPRKRKAQSSSEPPYTKEEKDWLKWNWKGEYKFLTAHELRIHVPDDREEGRRIIRAMMEQDGDEHSEPDDYDESEALEQPFERNHAVYPFTDEELEFIENGWGDSESFMLSYGLNLNDNEDCEEAKRTVENLMSQEDWGYWSGRFEENHRNKRQRLWV